MLLQSSTYFWPGLGGMEHHYIGIWTEDAVNVIWSFIKYSKRDEIFLWSYRSQRCRPSMVNQIHIPPLWSACRVVCHCHRRMVDSHKVCQKIKKCWNRLFVLEFFHVQWKILIHHSQNECNHPNGPYIHLFAVCFLL